MNEQLNKITNRYNQNLIKQIKFVWIDLENNTWHEKFVIIIDFILSRFLLNFVWLFLSSMFLLFFADLYAWTTILAILVIIPCVLKTDPNASPMNLSKYRTWYDFK